MTRNYSASVHNILSFSPARLSAYAPSCSSQIPYLRDLRRIGPGDVHLSPPHLWPVILNSLSSSLPGYNEVELTINTNAGGLIIYGGGFSWGKVSRTPCTALTIETPPCCVEADLLTITFNYAHELLTIASVISGEFLCFLLTTLWFFYIFSVEVVGNYLYLGQKTAMTAK